MIISMARGESPNSKANLKPLTVNEQRKGGIASGRVRRGKDQNQNRAYICRLCSGAEVEWYF